LAKPCGNCDCCLDPPKTWDGTIAAQKALSCVLRTGHDFGFGVSHLIEVLHGISTAKVRNHKHDELPTFGVGQDLDKDQWQSVFRQLIALNFVRVDFSYNTLKLAAAGHPILRGEQKVMFRTDVRPEKTERTRKVVKNVQIADDLRTRFWNALRDKRREIADAQHVPPYTIFHDATLMMMVESKPQTLEAFGELSGVGERKLVQYGQDFLNIIQSFSVLEDDDLSSSEISIRLYKLGNSVEIIAKLRQFQGTTIYGHLADGIATKELLLSDVIPVTAEEISDIETAIMALPEEFKTSLKPVFEQFGEKYSYGILRCVRAALS
ncbi:MAG: RQC domain-containing protein, partial [Methylococcales bacterium]|nr:RQC domain-containing protein [Methylococcales bacterium]